MTPLASRILPPLPILPVSKSGRKEKRLRYSVVEALEPRVVPAANLGAGALAGSLSAAQVDSLIAGLESLDMVLHDVDAKTEFANFAGLAKGAGDLFGLGSTDGKGGFFGDAFRDQLDAAFPGGATVANINAFLQTMPAANSTGVFSGVTWQLVQGGSYPGAHPFEWEMKITGDRATSVAAKLDGGPTFSTAPTVPVTATGSVTFSFGLDSGDAFFATLSDTSVKVAGTQAAPTGVIDFGGGNTFNITAGSVTVDSKLGVSLAGAEAADGILTGAELGTLHAASTPGVAVQHTGAGLAASYTMNTSPVAVKLLQTAAKPGGSAATLGYDANLAAGAASSLNGLFSALQTAGGTLSNNLVYTQPLPGVSGSLSDLTKTGDIFKLQSAASTYLATGTPTLQGLGNALKSALPADLKPLLVTGFDPATGEVTTKFNFGSTVTKPVAFDRFGEAASVVGLAFNHDEAFKFDLNTTYSGSLTVALNLSTNATTAAPTLTVGAGFSNGDFSLAATVGVLNAGLTHGSAALATTFNLGGAAKLTAAQLNGANPITLTGSGTFTADLPLDVGFGANKLTGAKLALSSSNVFTTPVAASKLTPQYDKLFALGRITADNVYDFLVDSGTWAGQFSKSPVFDSTIPLTESKLGEIVDFGALFAAKIKSSLENPVTYLVPQASFASFTLAAPLTFQILSGNTSLDVTLPQGNYATVADYKTALETALGASGYHAVSDGTGKVRLTKDGSTAFSIAGVATDLYKLGFLGSAPESSVIGSAPASSVLTSDAQFQISVNGAAPVTITVPASATTTNATLADLAADVQAALTSYGITVTVTGDGKLKLKQGSTQPFMIVPGAGSAAVGLDTALSAGMATQPSVTETGRSFQTLNDLIPVLAGKLGVAESALNAQFDFNTLQFSFGVDLAAAGATKLLPVASGSTLGEFTEMTTVDANGNPVAATISVTPQLTAHTTFGISLAGSPSFQELVVTPSKGFAPAGYNLNALGGPDPESAKAWDGRLTADAVITFSFDDGVTVPLTITKASTDTNASATDLAADINAAITANASLNGKIGARVVAGSGGTADRVSFFTKQQAGDFQIRTFQVEAGTSAQTDLGLEASRVTASAAPAVMLGGRQGTVDFAPSSAVSFKISLDGAAERTLTLSPATTAGNTSMKDLLADLNGAINADPQLNGKVRAIRIGAGSQFAFVASDTVQTLRIDPSASAATAFNFDDDPSIARTNGAVYTLKDTQLGATGTIAVDHLRYAGTHGFLGVHTADSTGTISFSAQAALESGANTTFTIGQLFSGVGLGTAESMVEKNFTGTANVTLSGLAVDGGLLALPGTAQVTLTSSNIFTNDGTLTVAKDGIPAATLTKLNDFSQLTWSDFYTGIKSGVQYLTKTEGFVFLKDALIPGLNLTVSDEVSYADALGTLIDKLAKTPATTLQGVEAQIETTLGLKPENFSLSLEDGSVVKVHFVAQVSDSDNVGLNVNFKNLDPLTNDPIDAELLNRGGFSNSGTGGGIGVATYAEVALDLGIDVSAAAPKFSVANTSSLTICLRALGQNLNVTAAFGADGVVVRDGSFLLDADGLVDGPDADDLPDQDFATIKFSTVGVADVTQVLAQLSGGAALTNFFTPTFNGKITSTLPLAVKAFNGEVDLASPITISVADIGGVFNKTPGSTSLSLPVFDGLTETPVLDTLLRNPAMLLDGLDSALAKVQSILFGTTAESIPLIGAQLKKGAGFIEDFREDLLARLTDTLRGSDLDLAAALQQVMFSFLSTDLHLVQDYNGDNAVTKDDVVITYRTASGDQWLPADGPNQKDAVQFNMHLAKTVDVGTDFKIDFGLPGLSLDIQGSPSVSAGFDIFLGFGVSLTDYFYVDPEPLNHYEFGAGGKLKETCKDTQGHDVDVEPVDHEVSFHFDAKLTTDTAHPFKAEGKLFFLKLTAEDTDVKFDPADTQGVNPIHTGKYSHVSGEFFVDLGDPGTFANFDKRLTLGEMNDFRGKARVEPGIYPIPPLDRELPFKFGRELDANINLQITASAGDSAALPKILTNFVFDWGLGSFESSRGPLAKPPVVGFTNTKLDLGSFVSDFLKPIVDKINSVVKPFDPVIEALTTKLPVLSDLMGKDYTVLDLAADFGNIDKRFVNSILQVREVISDIAALPAGTSILIPLGTMPNVGSQLMLEDANRAIDVSTVIQVASAGDPLNPTGDVAKDKYKAVVKKSTTLTGGGFGFPILQPANVFKLLLGQDATLVTYDVPRLDVGMSIEKSFPISPPLVGFFNGSISAYADLAFGFDTKGYNTYRISNDPADILDGFYVSDRANADGTGKDVYEAGITGHIGIGGAISGAIAEAAIEGFFEISANLDLKDPNNDGKIRGSEIKALLNYSNGLGPLNLGSIDLTGSVGASARVDLYVGFWKTVWEKEFARVELFTKHFEAPNVTPTIAATVTEGGKNVLTLNAGSTAGKRNFISTSDVAEEYRVTGSGKTFTLTFVNTGDTQSFTNVDVIRMNGGVGNDKLILDPGITSAVEFDGGIGDDKLVGGLGDDKIIGGAGNDILDGGGGNNTLDGGDGADTITGGSGADVIIGGAGDDNLTGSGGADIYKFADDWGRDVLDSGQTGNGTFDFTAATKGLTLNVSKSGASGTAGRNSINYLGADYITKILGGSGHDTVNVKSTGSAAVTIDSGAGSDAYVVNFGAMKAATTLTDSEGLSDTVQVSPLSGGYSIAVGQHLITGTKPGLVDTQTVNYGDGFENLTVDAKSSGGGSLNLTTALDFQGAVRLSGKTVGVEQTINARDVRLDTAQALTIGADVNGRVNGNITAIAGGDILLNGNLSSSTSSLFTGDGAGLIHLYASTGNIKTGLNDDGSTPRILADAGSLLLRGDGAIGAVNKPIYTQVATLAADAKGLINLFEANGLVVGEIGGFSGIKTGKADVTIFNDSAELRTEAPIVAGGSNYVTLTSDSLQINADITDPKGTVVLQPKGTTTPVAIGEGVDATFDLTQSEITHLQDGFHEILLGRSDAKALVKIGDLSISDPVVVRNPILGGHVSQTGVVIGSDNATFAIVGSGHTAELDNQSVPGEINIIDSAVIRDGETVTLESANSNVFLNFKLDGSAGLGVETLNLTAPNGQIVIKGNIGSEVKLGVLHVTAASSVRFEGTVRVGQLIIDDGASFVVDGLINADSVTVAGVDSSTFDSGLNVTGALNLTTTAGVVFKGGVQSSSLTVDGGMLVDFYQNVATGVADVKANGISGDVTFRQGFSFTTGTVNAADDATLIGGATGATLTLNAADVASFQAATSLTTSLGVTATSVVFANGATLDGGAITLNTTKPNVGEVRFTGNVQPDSLKVISARPVNFQAAIDVGALDVTGKSVLVEGTLDVTTGTFDIAGDLRFVSASNFATLGISNAVNTTFEGLLGVSDAITMSGSGATRFEGATKAASYNVAATQQIFAGSSLEATSGDLTLKSLEIDFGGGAGSVKGSATSTLYLVPDTATTTVDIGSPTPGGTLDISDTDLNAIKDSFAKVVIGRPDSTADFVVGSSRFNGNFVLQAGNVTFEENTVSLQDVRATGNFDVQSKGTITVNDDIFAKAITFTAVNGIAIHSTLNGTTGTLTATAGNLAFDTALNFTGTATLTATAGDIVYSADLKGSAVNLQTPLGRITQIGGRTITPDLTAAAKTGITLLTRTDHISADVTGTGALSINDDNAAPHVLHLGGAALTDRLFTADGDITVVALGNLSVDRVQANGKVNLTANKLTVTNLVGSPATITGTTIVSTNQNSGGQPIIYQGDILLMNDLTFESDGGDITITGRVLSNTGAQGLTVIADGGKVLIGGGDLEYLDVQGASTFTLNGALKSALDFNVEAGAIAITAPRRSITTTSGALHFQPLTDTAAIDVGRNGATFSLNDAELLALGDGWSEVEIGRATGQHAVQIESAQFVDNVTIHGASIALLASSTPQSVNGISVVNGNEKNHLFLLAQSSFTQGRRAGISAGGDVTIEADTMALDTTAANGIRGFGTLDLHTHTPGVAVTLGDAPESGELHLSAQELAGINSTFATVKIGGVDSGLLRVTSSLTFQNNVELFGGGDMEIAAGAGAALTLLNSRGRDLSLHTAGDITIEASLRTSGRGNIDVQADSDHSGAGSLTWGLAAGKVVQKAVTVNGDLSLGGTSVKLGVTPLPAKAKAPVWAFESRTGRAEIETTGALNVDNAGFTTTGDLAIAAATSAIATSKITARDVFIDAIAQNSLTATAIKALAAVRLHAAPVTGAVALDAKTNISAVASILVEAGQFTRNGAKLKAPLITTP